MWYIRRNKITDWVTCEVTGDSELFLNTDDKVLVSLAGYFTYYMGKVYFYK